jgi:hypothetical protein
VLFVNTLLFEKLNMVIDASKSKEYFDSHLRISDVRLHSWLCSCLRSSLNSHPEFQDDAKALASEKPIAILLANQMSVKTFEIPLCDFQSALALPAFARVGPGTQACKKKDENDSSSTYTARARCAAGSRRGILRPRS